MVGTDVGFNIRTSVGSSVVLDAVGKLVDTDVGINGGMST